MKAKWLLLTKLQLWELSGLNKLRHSSDGRQRRRMLGVTAAIGLMCLAGDQALEKTGHHATASFHTAMFDALSAITPEALAAALRLEQLN